MDLSSISTGTMRTTTEWIEQINPSHMKCAPLCQRCAYLFFMENNKITTRKACTHTHINGHKVFNASSTALLSSSNYQYINILQYHNPGDNLTSPLDEDAIFWRKMIIHKQFMLFSKINKYTLWFICWYLFKVLCVVVVVFIPFPFWKKVEISSAKFIHPFHWEYSAIAQYFCCFKLNYAV